jgi:hypothetical protein
MAVAQSFLLISMQHLVELSDITWPKLYLLEVSLASGIKVARFIRNFLQIISRRPLQPDTKNLYRGLRILTTIFSAFTQKRSCFLQPTSTMSLNKFKDLRRGNIMLFIVLPFFCFLDFNFFQHWSFFVAEKKLCSRNSTLAASVV